MVASSSLRGARRIRRNCGRVALWSSTLLKPGSSIWTTDVCVPVSSLSDLIADTKKDLEKSVLPAPMAATEIFISSFSSIQRIQRCIGKKKLPLELGETTVELMRNIRHTIDPNHIMNPGKIIPDEYLENWPF
ncbi:hypothetical protein BC937DRAFT_92476 [Endogone sp. FLAS-F59071]|nr:hypothetical protein BC937DRAFT_92476 [Endogone sp. FLAS-F59071]|eukprot:RUS21507.1 hypothetical protein BC937DRAFT_92476 [Endogone sp. FLAS-F59071]